MTANLPRLPILLYHSISAEASPRYQRWAVPPAVFADHLTYLKQQGYTPLTVHRWIRMLADPTIAPPLRPILLTFDDGLADFYEGALPLLTERGYPATLFVTTGWVGKTARWLQSVGEPDRPMLTWRQIIEIDASGIECGAHSVTHPQLDILPVADARREIFDSQRTLADHLGHDIPSFAYPHGYYNPHVHYLVAEAGYSAACAVKNAFSSPADDPLALARLVVTAETNLPRLLADPALPVAPLAESLSTKGWRLARRALRVRAGFL